MIGSPFVPFTANRRSKAYTAWSGSANVASTATVAATAGRGKKVPPTTRKRTATTVAATSVTCAHPTEVASRITSSFRIASGESTLSFSYRSSETAAKPMAQIEAGTRNVHQRGARADVTVAASATRTTGTA